MGGMIVRTGDRTVSGGTYNALAVDPLLITVVARAGLHLLPFSFIPSTFWAGPAPANFKTSPKRPLPPPLEELLSAGFAKGPKKNRFASGRR